MSGESTWTCQQSVDVAVPVTLAWQFMTDVRNWSDPPAEFTLEGPFEPGTRGTTRMPGQPTNAWTIRDVDPGRGYSIVADSFFENASLIVHWRFEGLPDGRTRLTQRLELCGENAARYIDSIRSAFEPNLEPGMQRIARMMAARARTEAEHTDKSG
jgi:polyketide cyclase/dehydrase/lipid transport protein